MPIAKAKSGRKPGRPAAPKKADAEAAPAKKSAPAKKAAAATKAGPAPKAAAKKAAAKKPAAKKPGRKSAAGRRGRKPLVVALSKQTERAAQQLGRADAKVEVARERLRAKVAAARKVAGKGRGKRPSSPKAAERAKGALAKVQAAFMAARAIARDARKNHRLSLLEDRQRAQLTTIVEKARATTAAAEAKAAAKVERLVERFRSSKERSVLGKVRRAGKRLLKAAERKAAATEKRLARQFAKASGKKAARKARRKA